MIAVLIVRNRPNNEINKGFLNVFPAIEKKDWPRLLVVSVIGATLAPWLGIEGLALTYGARASLWLALGPVLSAIIGYFLANERIGRYGYIGIILAGIGTLILSFGDFQQQTSYWQGDILLFAALVFSVAELHLIKPLARKYGSVSIVTFRTLIGCSLYLMIALPSLIEQPWLSLNFWTWVAILAGGGIGVGIGMWAKVSALHHLGPTRVVIYGNLVPVVTLLIAWFSIGTNPSMYDIISAVFIIGGAILLQWLDSANRQPGE